MAARHDRAIVLVPLLPGARRDPELHLAEAAGLARALGLAVAEAQTAPVRKRSASTLLGKGLTARLAEQVSRHNAGLVIIDAALSPVQQRNLERALGAKVIDRTGVILEIFALRARTKEGRMQVELALLTYQRSRLVRSWTHLERQRGGKGFLAGPGERQLETDRRLLDQRIARLERQLDELRRTRALHRAARARAPWPVIALVGYTNAGKSTLFNALSGETMLARDMLFATLDPAMRRIDLGHGRSAILSDTVGFIADLPTELVAAFRATLEEVLAADLIVHVRDISSPHSAAQRDDVRAILAQLMARQDSTIPVLEAWNKIDRIEAGDLPLLQAQAASMPLPPVLLSAARGEGLEALKAAMAAVLERHARTLRILVPPGEGRVIPWLCRHGRVLESTAARDGGQTVLAQLDAPARGALQAAFPALETELVTPRSCDQRMTA